MKSMVWAGIAALVLSTTPAMAKEYRIGDLVHHEEPESTSAETAARCLSWSADAAIALRFRVYHLSSTTRDAQTKVTNDELMAEGKPTIVIVHPYIGEESRRCTIRAPTADELKSEKPLAVALIGQPGISANAYALRLLEEQDDTFTFLAAGPVYLDKERLARR